MNPLIPTPDTLPVSWGYFQSLLMLMFPLHLLLMNAMLGCVALSLYALMKGGKPINGWPTNWPRRFRS